MAEKSTFENELPKKSTVKWLRGLDENGNPVLIDISDHATVVGGLLPVVTTLNNGVLSTELFKQIMIRREGNFDFDDTTLPSGLYSISKSGGSPTGNNWSGIEDGMLIVANGAGLSYGGNPKFQIAISYNSATIKVRMNWAGSWSPARNLTLA